MKKQLLSLFFILLFCTVSFAQTATNLQCGQMFFDSGGTGGNYPNSANEIYIICPQTSGDAVTVNFTSFETETNWDGLYVFNGASLNSPQISSANGPGNVPGNMPGAFWGNALPGPFTSTSPDGCLTFWFRSDTSVSQSGWAAEVSCGTFQTCPVPVNLAVSEINSNYVTFSWAETGTATLWEVLALPCGSPAPASSTAGNLATANPFFVGSLAPATCYDFYVRANCFDSVSAWSSAATATTLNPLTGCGQGFFDNGNSTANYSNSSNQTTTICPENPGEKVRVTFTLFDVEEYFDGLYVYNGNSMFSPQIASANPAGTVVGGIGGAFWGSALPGPFESSSADGCLTFVFRSDSTGNAAGWIANVTCGQPSDCEAPTNIQVTDVTSDSAMISWNSAGSASQWQIIANPGNATPIVTSQNPYTLTGLMPDTNYTIMISAICEDGLATGYQTFAFQTTIPPANPIVVNTGLYTSEELVNNVLIGNPCLEISNVTSVTGTNFNGPNGIGFFQNTNPTFPLTSGIVLCTGNANNIFGPNLNSLSEGTFGWPGDSDLEAVVTSSIGQPMNSQNASMLEFDFTALNEFMSFNFLFASEEYGTFQCNFADAFAFLLTDMETGITTNLAVIPGTQTPVSVVTIRDSLYNNGCASANESYFDQYFTAPEYLSATNFNGQTHLMTASSALIPNHPYHIKLVIADRSDTAYDSAVFIEAGSFTSGPPQCSDKLELVAFVDENSNAIKDDAEIAFNHGSFAIEQNDSGTVSQVYSPTGTYNLYDANPANSYGLGYVLQSEYSAYYACSAAYDNLTIPVGAGSQTIYFPVTLTQPYNDVAISIVPVSAPRPGLTYKNKVVYSNNGISPTSGTITFTKDALVTITNVSQTGTVANANGFTYNFTNLLPNETRMFFVTMAVPDPPVVNLDDLLTNSAAISAPSNDVSLANNQFSNTQIAVNSYDPNMIVEAHGEQIDINNFSVNEFLYYTIYFQNTGTAMAINILLEDVLDDQLNDDTVVMLNSSHNYIMERNANHLTWKFDHINLPGQLQDEELSKGFVFFKVKVKPGFQEGDIIPNQAAIYFDNNPVVLTNTFNTIFINSLQNDEWQANNVILFPNPANTSFTVNMGNAGDSLERILVHDMLGKTVRAADIPGQNQASVDVSGLAKGIYLVEILTEGERRLVRKLIIE